MLADCLEVEENLKMSKKLSDHDHGGEIKGTYKLVGPYKQKKEAYGLSKISHGMQKDDRLEVEINGPVGLFSEDGDLPHSWSTRDDFKKEFGVPVYDKYEEEYLQNIPNEPSVEKTPTDERNQSAMKNQEGGARKDDEGTGGDSLPLCYASFELIRHMIKASKQKQKETEVVQARNLYENEDGCKSLQINTFSDTPPSGTSPHMEGVCLLGSTGEAEDLPLEAHQALVT